MPKNTIMLLVRHGEKPENGVNLAVPGYERAAAYSVYFQNYTLNGNTLKPNLLFASKDSNSSSRPEETLTPLSNALGKPINTTYADADYDTLAQLLINGNQFDNQTLVICWHHGKILDLAKALGAHHHLLPKSANWPQKWPGSVFGWLLQLVFDANGNLDTNQTICINQKMMYDDHGNDPPGK